MHVNDVQTKIRSVFGTWNNPAVTDFDQLVEIFKPKYMVAQLETAQTGTLHWQFAVQFPSPRSFAAIKKAAPLAHLEPVKSWQAAIAYCTKEDSRHSGPWEHGDRPTGSSGAGQTEDWDHWYKLASEGKFSEIPAKIKIKHYGNLQKIYRDSIKLMDQEDVRGVWIHGKPGCGKSHFARVSLNFAGVYPKSANKWWDGYQNQPVVVLEDLDRDTIKFLYHHLKIWADKWGFIGEAKGGAVAPNNRWLVITSNYTLPELLSDLNDNPLKLALLRRFRVFNMLSRDSFLETSTKDEYSAEALAAILKI